MLDIEKAVHAAAYLVEKAGGCLWRRQLCRQLYLSERTFLLFHSDSFTGDPIVATKDGPALEECQGILSASELHDPWSRWLEFGDEETVLSRNRSGNSTGMLVEDFDALSLADVKVLDQVFEQYESLTREAFLDISPERQEPSGAASPIDLEALLMRHGKSLEQARAIAEQVRETEAIREYLRQFV